MILDLASLLASENLTYGSEQPLLSIDLRPVAWLKKRCSVPGESRCAWTGSQLTRKASDPWVGSFSRNSLVSSCLRKSSDTFRSPRGSSPLPPKMTFFKGASQSKTLSCSPELTKLRSEPLNVSSSFHTGSSVFLTTLVLHSLPSHRTITYGSLLPLRSAALSSEPR